MMSLDPPPETGARLLAAIIPPPRSTKTFIDLLRGVKALSFRGDQDRLALAACAPRLTGV